MDHLTCIDFNGDKIWQLAYGKAWDQSFPDTRSTPTIEEDRIYIISGVGELVCLNTETGDINWKINVEKDYILGASASELFFVDPENGEIRSSYKYFDSSLWKWHPRGMIWANSPLVKGNMIFLSIGYNYPAKMLKVNEEVTSIEEVYTNTLLDNHHHGLIELDGYLYRSYWISFSQFRIMQVERCFEFWLSWLFIPWQPGHLFFSRMYPQQRRQFIPHGAINSVRFNQQCRVFSPSLRVRYFSFRA